MQQYERMSQRKPIIKKPKVYKLKTALEVVATSKVLAGFKQAKAKILQDRVNKQRVINFIRRFNADATRRPLVHRFLPGMLIIHNIESS